MVVGLLLSGFLDASLVHCVAGGGHCIISTLSYVCKAASCICLAAFLFLHWSDLMSVDWIAS